MSNEITNKVAPLERVLNEQELLTAELVEILDSLEQKLLPVSRPAPPSESTGAEKPDPKAISPVVNQIENYNNRLRRAILKVSEIGANLEV